MRCYFVLFILYFLLYHSCRLRAAFLGGFMSLQQTADDADFSSMSKSSATKFCPELKVGKIGEKHALMASVTFTVLINKKNNRCQQRGCSSNNLLTVRS